MSHVIMPPTLEAMCNRMADDHGAMVAKRLEQALEEHQIALDDPGIAFKVQQQGLRFIYVLERDGVALCTFGIELDLTGLKYNSPSNDVDISKILV